MFSALIWRPAILSTNAQQAMLPKTLAEKHSRHKTPRNSCPVSLRPIKVITFARIKWEDPVQRIKIESTINGAEFVLVMLEIVP